MPESAPDVAVIGFGYIGSVIAAVLAERGFSVVGIDTNARMIEAVKAGRCPIPEPGLDELVGKGVASGRLTASTDPAAARGARAVLITVGTPLSDEYTADLAHIRAACASVAPYLHDGQIVMIKSTVPPGTTRAMHEEIITTAPLTSRATISRARACVTRNGARRLTPRILSHSAGSSSSRRPRG